MKAKGTAAPRKRIELGRCIVADSGICHGKPKHAAWLRAV